MTKKEQVTFEKWARPILEKAQRALLLNHFGQIAISYGCENKNAYAECVNYDPYVSIIINCSHELLSDFKKKSKHKGIKDTLIHEMCHPLTDPLFNRGSERFITSENISKEREKLTDHIANILITHKLV